MNEETFVVDGDNNLQQQENTLNTAQNLLFAEVTRYTKGAQIPTAESAPSAGPEHPNFVSVTEIALGALVKPIALVIPTDLAIEEIKQAGEGRSLVFFSEVFVNGVVKKVAGFR